MMLTWTFSDSDQLGHRALSQEQQIGSLLLGGDVCDPRAICSEILQYDPAHRQLQVNPLEGNFEQAPPPVFDH